MLRRAVTQAPVAAATNSLKEKFNIAGEALTGRSAYLDLQATTPLDLRVLDKYVSAGGKGRVTEEVPGGFGRERRVFFRYVSC